MVTVVITGSTKGVGRGLANAFISRGHNVTICSRNSTDVARAVTELAAKGPGKAAGKDCDITSKAQVQALWDHAAASFGSVDIWINNAGRAVSQYPVRDLPEELVHTLVDGNLKGTVFCSQVAINGFRQQGRGALYNVLGGSFTGKRLTPNMGVYSATKAAIDRVTRYLVAEDGTTDIIIGSISPGMLITENWFEEQSRMSPEEWAKIKPILNILCDHVEDAAPWLAEQVLANRKNGHRIAWLTTGKMLGRFMTARLPGGKRELFARYGL